MNVLISVNHCSCSPAGRLDEYLACIAKIQKAVEYFQDNNPDSPELNTVVRSSSSHKLLTLLQFE